MSKTILLALEDQNITGALAPLLEAEGFTLVVETHGQWALRIFEKRSIDVVVLGSLGGETGGLELAAKIRKTIKGQTAHLLMISETPRKASILTAAQRAFDLIDVLETPLHPEHLLAALRKTLGYAYPSPKQVAAERARLDMLGPGRFADPDSERERTEVEEHSGRFKAAPRAGSLSTTPFAELLGQLYAERARGALLLIRGRIKKIVYFADGTPSSIRSNRLEECLGRFLVRARMITEKECARSLARMKASGRQQGTLLVAMGCISPASLRRALELQLQMKLFDPFGWPDGTFRFDPGVRAPAAPVPLTISAATAVHLGIQRKLPQARLAQHLEADLARALVPHSDPRLRFQTLDLSPPEQTLLQAIQTGQPLRQLLADRPQDQLALLQLIYTLKCTGMFLVGDATARPTDPPAVIETPPIEPLAQPPTVAAGQRELTHVRQALAEELVQAQEQDYFELLDLPRDADLRQIEEAFRGLARRFHPDHATHTGSTQVRRLNQELFELICKAHRVLSDDAMRAAYLDQLRGANPPEASDMADRALRAEALFSKASQALHGKDYTYARAMLEQAVGLCPDEGEYRAALGLALFRSDPDNTSVGRQARDELNQAITASPTLDKAHLYLGWIYRRMGQRALSVHEFEQALLCNPKCVEAVRELRLLRNRKQPKKKGLGKLLSKWKR